MNASGWVTMLISVGGVMGLFIWCIAKVLGKPQAANKIHSQVDIDTHDRDT